MSTRSAKKKKLEEPSVEDESAIWEFVHDQICILGDHETVDMDLFEQYVEENKEIKWSAKYLLDYFNSSMREVLYKSEIEAEKVLRLYKTLKIEISPHVESIMEARFSAILHLNSSRTLRKFAFFGGEKREKSPKKPETGVWDVEISKELEQEMWNFVEEKKESLNAQLIQSREFWEQFLENRQINGIRSAILLGEHFKTKMAPKLWRQKLFPELKIRLIQGLKIPLDHQKLKHLLDSDKVEVTEVSDDGLVKTWRRLEIEEEEEGMDDDGQRMKDSFMEEMEDRRRRKVPVVKQYGSNIARWDAPPMRRNQEQGPSTSNPPRHHHHRRGPSSSPQPRPDLDSSSSFMDLSPRRRRPVHTTPSPIRHRIHPPPSSSKPRHQTEVPRRHQKSPLDLRELSPPIRMMNPNPVRPVSRYDDGGEKKRVPFTTQDQIMAWNHLYDKIKEYLNDATGRLQPVQPKGIAYWNEFVKETKSKKTPTNWSSHFRKQMCPNLQHMPFPPKKMLALYHNVDIDVDDELKGILERKCQVKIRVGLSKKIIDWKPFRPAPHPILQNDDDDVRDDPEEDPEVEESLDSTAPLDEAMIGLEEEERLEEPTIKMEPESPQEEPKGAEPRRRRSLRNRMTTMGGGSSIEILSNSGQSAENPSKTTRKSGNPTENGEKTTENVKNPGNSVQNPDPTTRIQNHEPMDPKTPKNPDGSVQNPVPKTPIQNPGSTDPKTPKTPQNPFQNPEILVEDSEEMDIEPISFEFRAPISYGDAEQEESVDLFPNHVDPDEDPEEEEEDTQPQDAPQKYFDLNELKNNQFMNEQEFLNAVKKTFDERPPGEDCIDEMNEAARIAFRHEGFEEQPEMSSITSRIIRESIESSGLSRHMQRDLLANSDVLVEETVKHVENGHVFEVRNEELKRSLVDKLQQFKAQQQQ